MMVGCANPYPSPQLGEDASLIMLSFAHDHAALSDFQPSGILSVSVSVKEGWHQYSLYTKSYGTILAQRRPAPLEMVERRIRPSREITVQVWLGVTWQTPGVQLAESRHPGEPPVMVLTEDIQSRGCKATVTLRPEKNKAYQLDYSSLGVDRSCKIQFHEEVPAETSGALYRVGGQYRRNM